MLTWAILSGAMMFVTTPWAFYVIRFLLGVAEAGLFPGVILYLTYWYPAERRGKIIALFMTGIPMAGVIGGPLSGWIMQSMGGIHGLAAWQWLFLIEAVPSVVLSVGVLLYLDNGIENANWLSSGEKAILARNVALDSKRVEASSAREGFTNPRVWLLCATYFFFIMGLYGVGFWLPTLIKGTGITSTLSIGLLTVLPYGAGTIAMVAMGMSSDRVRERRWHLAIPGLIGALAWVASVKYGNNMPIAIAALTVATAGVMVTLSQFWSCRQ
jgi:MFS family permease